jgi:hypothetical protein
MLCWLYHFSQKNIKFNDAQNNYTQHMNTEEGICM